LLEPLRCGGASVSFPSTRLSYLAMPSLRTVITGLVLAHLSLASPGKYPPAYHHGSASENDTLGAVASESSICSDIGINVLKEGGNAADSLIATTFCVGVIGMVRRSHTNCTDIR